MSTPVHTSLGVHVTNTGAAINHGDAAVENGFAGKAVKQKTRGWGDGVANQAVIDSGEAYYLLTQGVTEFADPGLVTPALGDPVYVTDATGVIVAAPGAGIRPLGKITAIGGIRGVAVGKIRVDLSARDAI